LNRILGMAILVAGVAQAVLALPAPPGVPEIGASSAFTVLSLISGSLMVIRGRRKR